LRITSREIVELLKTARELGYQEFRLEHDGLYLSASSTAQGIEPSSYTGAPVPSEPPPLTRALQPEPSPVQPAAPQSKAAASPAPAREGLLDIVAPMSGTFYRSPSPGAPPFVDVGSSVKANDVVCIIEVMKLFNSIRAGIDGNIEEILVDNEGSVVAGQVVIRVKPAGR